MATRKQKVKVGVFVTVCTGLLIATTLVVTGIYRDPGESYWIEFDESVLGLYENGPVEYLGVQVGKVREIYVTNNQRAHVELVINPKKVQLRQGVEAQLVLYSFASGTMAIDLSGGDRNAPQIPPNSQIPTKPSIIGSISKQITDVMEEVKNIASKVNIQLDKMGEDDVKQIVDHLKSILEKGEGLADKGGAFLDETTQTVKDARGQIHEVVDTLLARSKDLEKLSKSVEKLLKTTTIKVDDLDVKRIQENLNATLKNISTLTENLDKTVNQMSTVASDVSHDANNVEFTLRSTMTDLRHTFDSLRILLEQLQQDPSQLVRGKGNIKAAP